jgi:osmoprotectant transport system permease protein
MSDVTLSRVGLFGALLGLASLLFADFAVIRPNRLAPGEGASVFALLCGWQWGLLLAGFAALGVASLTGREKEWTTPARIGFVFTPLLCLGLVAAQGHAASASLDPANPFMRVSVGAAFWLALLGLFVAFTDFSARIGRTGARWAVLLRGLVLVGFGGGLAGLLISGGLDELSLAREYVGRSHRFFIELRSHLMITGLSVGSAAVLGLPLGVVAYKWKRLRAGAFSVLNIVQTIPSLALFGLLIAPLAWLSTEVPLLREFGVRGIGWAPAVIALCLYALLPIVRNTFAGFERIEPAVIEAGRGMGMGRLQLFVQVELPVASPIILNGLRIAGVQNMGNTAVAALIGAGGFGVFIFQGLGQSAIDLVMLGAVPTILLAVGLDLIFQLLTRLATPRGLR